MSIEENTAYGYFGREMRTWRECNLWTLEHVARHIGTGVGKIVSIERGTWLPEVAVVDAWCNFLGCTEAERRVWHQYAARSHGWRI